MIKRYRRRPVEVDALQFTTENLEEMCAFVDVGSADHQAHILDTIDDLRMTFLNEAGLVMVNRGDWVVKDDQGGLYSYRPDVFAKTFMA